MSGKWLELLKQIAPGVTRAAVLWDPAIPAGIGQFAVIQSVAPSLAIDVTPIDLRDIGEAARDIALFAGEPNCGLIVPASGLAAAHRDRIIALAARHKLPAVYNNRIFVTGGGLISYGLIWPTSSAARRATLTASSRARNRPICRCRRRPSTSW